MGYIDDQSVRVKTTYSHVGKDILKICLFYTPNSISMKQGKQSQFHLLTNLK